MGKIEMFWRYNREMIIQNISNDETPDAAHPEPTFNIRTLTITDITVFASGAFTVVTDKTVEAKIDEIVLHDIGTDGDAEVATEAITSAVTHAIMEHLQHHPVEGFSKLAFSPTCGKYKYFIFINFCQMLWLS